VTEIISVEITCPDAASARAIAEAAVGERLAACAHLHLPIESVYHWKGRIERAQEVLLVLKTRAGLFPQLAARVRALHAYELPAILATPVPEVTDDYRAWLLAETDGGGGSRMP
jgi:periplasmic divalent cation tolerance protein